MDYFKTYNSLIENRRQLRKSKKTKGYELHHILPKCLGGDDTEENLVSLTIREHYIAHWLLIKMYPDEPKLYYAFLCMLRNPHGYRVLPSRMYETIKSNFSKFRTWRCKEENPMHQDSARRKISENMKNNNPIKRFPEKNHTVCKTIVYYEDGTVKEFAMKKLFMETLEGLTHMQKRYKIENNDLKEFGIVKIERIDKMGNKK